MRIGLVGVGIMGRPMAEKLLVAGHELAGYDALAGAVESVSGAMVATSPADVARVSDLVLTALPTTAAVRSVYEAMAPAARPGQVFADHSTVDPATNAHCARLLKDKRADFLDAPMSGGPEGVVQASLTLFVGGEEEAYRRALPVFECYAGTIRLCGPAGSGTALKLVNQLLVVIHNGAAAEATFFATKLGVDLQVVLEMISASYGSSKIFNTNLPRVIARDFKPDRPIRILVKDMSIVREVAEQTGAPIELAGVVEHLLHEAKERGLGDEDISALVKLYEERSSS
jgi:3-hydroxyisobutyrate dehydrogenase/2-hydroxy-3-oxopropionate reductase